MGRRSHAPLSGALVALLVACQTPTIGTSFARPPPDSIHLGETTRAQIVATYGKPGEEQQLRTDGHVLNVITYYYGSRDEAPRITGSLCIRQLNLALFNDVVVAEVFNSSCEADHTDFDDGRVAGISKGTTRCDDVLAALGRPASRSIYPAIANPGDQSIGYVFNVIGPGPVYSPTVTYRYAKRLEVTCGPDGVVRDVTFLEEGKR
jgi:hypothetical protein